MAVPEKSAEGDNAGVGVEKAGDALVQAEVDADNGLGIVGDHRKPPKRERGRSHQDRSMACRNCSDLQKSAFMLSRGSTPLDEETGKWLGTQGWRQLLTCKKELLDAFDRARQHSRSHEVETYHGIVAESQFRNWLSDFLPKRYGVTAGYIVSQGASENEKLPAFDVIIFDQFESPVLWIESHPDVTPQGRMRAIPAEYVKAVVEVKATWNSATATKAVRHLGDLASLLAGHDSPVERYKKFLPVNFTSWVVFFDVFIAEGRSLAAMNNLLPDKLLRGYRGGVVLRGEGLPPETTGRLQYCVSQNGSEVVNGLEKSVVLRQPDWSLLRSGSFSDPSLMEDTRYYQMCLTWFPHHFSQFAFELIACVNGTFDGRMPTFHGFPGQSDM